MKIAIDITPIKDSKSAHKLRGVGSYISLLSQHIESYDKKNSYVFFTTGDKMEDNLDLVHYPYFDPFFLTLPQVKLHKTIVTVHDLIPLLFPEHFPIGVKGNLKWLAQRFSLINSSGVITDSYSSQKDIAKLIGISLDKIHVAHLAVAPEYKKVENHNTLQEMKKKYGLPEKFVLYVGDITWNKNVPLLIEAIKKINVSLVIAGKVFTDKSYDTTHPWNQNLVKVQNSIKDDNRFLALGFVPQDDLVKLYNLATVFVMPSFYEGFGLPILEAMSCGCPVVTSKISSIPEVAEDAVFYVDPESIDDIANGIGGVFFNQEIQKALSKKGQLQAKKFSIEKMISQTIHAYEKVVG